MEETGVEIEPEGFGGVFTLEGKGFGAEGQAFEEVQHLGGLFAQLPVVYMGAR